MRGRPGSEPRSALLRSSATGPLRTFIDVWTGWSRRFPLLEFAGRIGILLAVAFALELWTVRLTRLPEASFGNVVIAAGLVTRLTTANAVSLLTIGGLLGAAALSIRWRSLGPQWHDFESGPRLRWLIGIVTLLLAWVFATYDYNFYFDQAHPFERLLLLVLVPCVVWRPVFVFPFVTLTLAVAGQFDHPIAGFSMAAPILLVRVMFVFAAFWIVRVLTPRAPIADLLFLICCLVGAHYWVSGYGKLELGWLVRDKIGFLLPATYANGWLAFLEPDTISSITKTLLRANVPMKAVTLLVECGALVMVWRRSTVQGFLIAAIALHAAVWLVTGIGFWSWMLLDAALLIFFFRPKMPGMPIFTPGHFVLSLVLIGGGATWFRPVKLAWLDAPATYTYRVEAEGESGRSYALPPAFFAPYDYQFTLGAFRYLVDDARLPITWGAIGDPALVEVLNRTGTAEEVFALEAERGRSSFDAARSATFDRFMQRFVGNWSARRADTRWWTWFRAPPLLWTFPRGTPATGGDRIRGVVVYEILSFFDGDRYMEIRKVPVRVIPIPQ